MKRLHYACRSCGAEHTLWTGHCRACGAFNTLALVVPAHRSIDGKPGRGKAPADFEGYGRYKVVRPEPDDELFQDAPPRVLRRAADGNVPKIARRTTGLSELDRALDGGAPEASIVMIAGHGGLGKTTLLLQALGALTAHGKAIYVTAEQNEEPILRTAQRISRKFPRAMDVLVTRETDIDLACQLALTERPFAMAFDSIQTFAEEGYTPGTVSEAAKCTAKILRVAQALGILTFVVSQVNKEGEIVGANALKHLVDAILFLEGDELLPWRTLYATKNRDGQVGVKVTLKMTKGGLVDSTAEAEEADMLKREKMEGAR